VSRNLEKSHCVPRPRSKKAQPTENTVNEEIAEVLEVWEKELGDPAENYYDKDDEDDEYDEDNFDDDGPRIKETLAKATAGRQTFTVAQSIKMLSKKESQAVTDLHHGLL
jgi:hypothetical protein